MRLSRFLNYGCEQIGQEPILAPARKTINTVEKHRQAILARRSSDHSNARIEGVNSLSQAAKARSRGVRKGMSFITVIYLIGVPIQDLLVSI